MKPSLLGRLNVHTRWSVLSTFCVESELINRPDGLKGMLETYGGPLGSPQGVPNANLKTF